jgi:hypothetical protein
MADIYSREPLGAFHDLAKENYCKAISKGKSIKDGSVDAGVAYETARKWDKAAEIQQRISELRSMADEFVGVSIGWVLKELTKNVELARTKGQLKVSTETLKTIYDIVTKNPDLINDMPIAAPEGDTSKPASLRLVASLSTLREQLDQQVVAPERDEEPA